MDEHETMKTVSMATVNMVTARVATPRQDDDNPTWSGDPCGRYAHEHRHYAYPLPNEDEVVHRWWSLPRGSSLPLAHGGACRLLFAGRPGGSAGPDVRDAVLSVQQGRRREKLVGDVEFHVRSSDWVVHQHHTDPRYNGVVLHVVLVCDDAQPTLRQDGKKVPVCSLYDLPLASVPPVFQQNKDETWPCHSIMRQLSDEERCVLLRRAGLLRFEQTTHAFVEQLHALSGELHNTTEHPQGDAPPIHSRAFATSGPPGGASLCGATCLGDMCPASVFYNISLIPALAEGLAYGRDRVFFRAAGLRLLGQAEQVPEPLGRASLPAPLDAGRLHVLRMLIEQVRDVWRTLHQILVSSGDMDTKLHVLRSLFCDLGLSMARTDILLCNVVLPFAAAVALLEHDVQLVEYAQELYEMHPGLSSNRVTRMMCAQLLLFREPSGSCQQQGLHYIYQQTCQVKQCDVCMAGRKVL